MISTAGEEKSREVTGAVSKLAAHYRLFGIGLGILPSKVDEIERLRKTPTTPNDKLSQVVTLRLGQLPAPTWKTFIDAARPINRALAEGMCKQCPEPHHSIIIMMLAFVIFYRSRKSDYNRFKFR